jgi:predicted nucleotidyltransferase
VLRALQDSKEGMSGRAVARAANINHQACANAIRNLEMLGILHRQGAGQSQLVKLNRDNTVVQELLIPLLKKERELIYHMRDAIRDAVKKDALSATIFGSFARQENRPGSDLDVLIVTEKNSAKARLESQDLPAQFKQKFGVRLAPIILSRQEIKRRFKKGDPLVKNILREGQDLLSRRFKEALS